MASAFEDLLARFVTLASESEEVRNVRGPAMALAMDWLIRLPDGPGKDKALGALADAADLAAATYGPN